MADPTDRDRETAKNALGSAPLPAPITYGDLKRLEEWLAEVLAAERESIAAAFEARAAKKEAEYLFSEDARFLRSLAEWVRGGCRDDG